jgi:5-methylcytosine-specific restriction endonuclease McrA
MIKLCPKCSNEFESKGKWGERKFCSRSCANSKEQTPEIRKKKSDALKGKPVNRINIEKWKENIKQYWLEKYLNTPFDQLGMENRRRRVFEEQRMSCARCGISEWLNSPLTLELDHKDGNSENNVRENLEGLCPNCHSLTDTWRGRNKPAVNGKITISDEELLEHLTNTDNIRQGLLSAGLAAKGGNYNRAKRLLGLKL